METRAIPSTGVALPVVGCGTYVGFDVGMARADRQRLGAVVQALFEGGGSILDSSPMYGKAEAVVGDLIAQPGMRAKAFVATKVWTRGRDAGIAEMNRSLVLLRAEPIDLMQVHNLLDWRTHLSTMRTWKAEGRIRHVGVTHYTASGYAELETVMRGEALDTIQINYALDERGAEDRILPLAHDRGMAVLINRPFGGGGLLRRLRGRPLPDWAGEIACTSWPQLLLKFVLSHPAVTCAIPGTGASAHMADNCRAGSAPWPDAAMRARIITAVIG